MMTKYMSNSMSNTNVNELLSNSDLSFLASDRFAIIPGFCDVHVHFVSRVFRIRKRSKQELHQQQEVGTLPCVRCLI